MLCLIYLDFCLPQAGFAIILMSKIDKIKADISLHEKMFFGFMAAFFAQVAWIVSNFETIEWWLLLGSFVMLIGTATFCIAKYRTIKRLIQEVEYVE